MAFVQPNTRDPRRAPGPRGRYRGLGADPVYCVGKIRTGGSYNQAGNTLLLQPDDRPGTVYTIVNPPWSDEVGKIVGYRGPSSRVAVVGALLSDNRVMITDGWGLMGPNEPWSSTQVTSNPGDCPDYVGFPFKPADVQDVTASAPEPDPPWQGSQVATIKYDAASNTVTVFGADGVTYTLDQARTPKAILDELKGPAPQGTRLVIDGSWDPENGTVAATDWFIESLGEGVKKYGVTDQGNLAEQSLDIPSTDWPGGLPDDPEAQAAALEEIGLDPADYGLGPTSSTGSTAHAGLGWLVGLALAGAVAYERGWFK